MKRKMYLSRFASVFFAGVFLFTHAISAWAASGDPDISFGTLSTFTDVVASKQMRPGAIAVQADGKLLVAGYMNQTAAPGGPAILLLRRYNANGSVDTGFGLSGFAIERILGTPYVYGYATSVAVQSDGKIVVAGGYYSSANQLSPAIFRFTTAGELDTTFGTDGRVTLPIGVSAGARNVTIFKNKILALLDDDLVALRPLDGSLDTSFGAAGFAHLGIHAYTFAVNLKRDMVVVGGYIHPVDGGNSFPRLQYFKSNGTPDTSRGTDGIVALDFAAPECFSNVNAVYSVDTQGGDGKVLVAMAGFFVTTIGSTNSIFRLRTDDSLDTSFGTGGFVERCRPGPDPPLSPRVRVSGGSSQIVGLINRAGAFNARNLKHFNTNGIFTFDSAVYEATDFVILPTSEKVVTVAQFYSANVYGIKLRRFLN